MITSQVKNKINVLYSHMCVEFSALLLLIIKWWRTFFSEELDRNNYNVSLIYEYSVKNDKFVVRSQKH